MTVRLRAAAAPAPVSGRASTGRLAAVALACLACCAVALACSLVVDAKTVDRFFPQDGVSGGDGGRFSTPRGIVIDQASPAGPKDGWKYVADQGNHRVQAFNGTHDSVFQWAIGRDVVKPGGAGNVPLNERQTITIGANTTGGNFALSWNPGTGNQTVSGIAWDASPAAVQAALESLAALEPGDVSVTSPNPGGGVVGGPYTVEFTGARADVNVNPMTTNATGLVVNPVGSTKVVTPATITEGANVVEKCTVATDCKAGLSGALGGMFNTPQGIDLNQTTGHFYVRDRGNNRVQEFDADGAFVRAWGWDTIVNGSASDPGNVTTFQVCAVSAHCKVGTTGSGTGQFGAFSGTANGVAVSPVSGNIYVADQGQNFTNNSGKRIQEFEPDGDLARVIGWDVVSSGPGNVGPSSFEICVPANGDVCKGGLSPVAGANGSFAEEYPRQLAIDSAGVLYASDNNSNSHRVLRFDTTQTTPAAFLLSPLNISGLTGTAATESTALTVSGGNLFVARSAAIGVVEIGAAGGATPTHVATHFTNTGLTPNGIAVHNAGGDLYVSSNTGAHRIYVLDDDGNPTPPDATILPPLDIDSDSATFRAIVNPQGFPTSYRFQYSRNGVDWVDAAPNQSIGEGTAEVPIDDAVTGLDANTTYRVRLVVTRGFGNGVVTSPEETFLTDAVPPEIAGASAGAITETSAILTGSIVPHGTPTSYRFEYGPGMSYGTSVPLPDAPVGAGHAAVFVKQKITGLEPDRTYHFRLVATSQTEGVSTTSDQVFRTRVSGPPGRGLELVSPADKIGGVGVGSYLNAGFRGAGYTLISADGERAIVGSEAGSALLDAKFEYANDYAFCERRGDSAGWECHTPFTHPNYTPSARRAASLSKYASDDLSLMTWGSNGGHIGVFPEVAEFPNSIAIPHLSDWKGRWEVAGPTALAQGGSMDDVGVAADGGTAVVQGNLAPGFVGGLSGPDDPYLDRSAGWASYVLDVSHGLSDSFPGTAIRAPLGVCTPGTELPLVEASGDVGARSCPPPVEYASGEFRSAALVSNRGAVLASTAQDNAISRDGSRIFFTDQSDGAPASCTGTEASTSCPSQLYVRQRNTDGTVSVRWLSRPVVAGQDASLLDSARFAGATADGDKVFFTTRGPLTGDDRNGTGSSPAVSGTPNANSNDLFMYDLPDGPDGDPATPDADPASGSLTRISAGPAGNADCNVGAGAARFIGREEATAYFVCADELVGADVTPPSGGATTPDGTSVTTTTAANLYQYRGGAGGDWKFVAQLPVGGGINGCATKSEAPGPPLDNLVGRDTVTSRDASCVRGTNAGDFLSLMTRGRLTLDDAADNSADVYVFDSDADRLTRVSATAGGRGGSYPCVTALADDVNQPCHAEMGGTLRALLDVVTDPAVANDRSVYFQSPLQLTADDDDEEFDVYEWRNGTLSLFTPDTGRDIYYAGNSVDGADVFLEALDRLSHEDKDAVMDIYDARVGGGIPDPGPARATCDVLEGACQVGGYPPPSASVGSDGGGDGNDFPGARNKLSLKGVSAAARKRAAKTGVLVVRATLSEGGTVNAVARAKVNRRTRIVARASRRVTNGRSPASLRLRLDAASRKRLASKKPLRVAVVVTARRAYEQSLTVTLKRGGK